MKILAVRSFDVQDPLPTLGAKVPRNAFEKPKLGPAAFKEVSPGIWQGRDCKLETRFAENYPVFPYLTNDAKRVPFHATIGFPSNKHGEWYNEVAESCDEVIESLDEVEMRMTAFTARNRRKP